VEVMLFHRNDNTIRLWDKSSASFYYQGIAQIEINDSLVARKNLNIALDLITKGCKNSDSYVALFDGVYQMEIEKKIMIFRKKKRYHKVLW
jgi:hypothetical protein